MGANTMFNHDCQCYHVARDYYDFAEYIKSDNRLWNSKGLELVGSFLYFSPGDGASSRLAMVEEIDERPVIKLLDASGVTVVESPEKSGDAAKTDVLEFDRIHNRYILYTYNIKSLPRIQSLGTERLGITFRDGTVRINGDDVCFNELLLSELVRTVTDTMRSADNTAEFLKTPALSSEVSYYPLWTAPGGANKT